MTTRSAIPGCETARPGPAHTGLYGCRPRAARRARRLPAPDMDAATRPAAPGCDAARPACDALLVRHASPTLAGLKTGSLFACPFACAAEMRRCLRGWNAVLRGKGLCALPLRLRDGRALLYVCRMSALARDLDRGEAQALLRGAGYRPAHPAACIRHLIGRLRQETDFPHEIGLFLGYPPEDVRGFIQRGACGCKCAGCWKVYGDEAAARAQFARFERCTRDCCARYAAGVPIERLAVAG